ncbi:MAG: hypothetical protein HYX48_06705 [Chlamydiales bacterium]|nr:hypothetical protein [Chlamydiales bacterium]
MTDALTFGMPILFRWPMEQLSWGEAILQEADAFFSIFSDKVAVVDPKSGPASAANYYIINIYDAEPFEWSLSTVLKVAFCFTLVIPLIVFIVKLIMRSTYNDFFKVPTTQNFDWRSLPSVAALDLTTPVPSTFTSEVIENMFRVQKRFTREIRLEEVFDSFIRYLKCGLYRNDDDQGGTFTFDHLHLARVGFDFRFTVNATGGDGRNFAEIVFEALQHEGIIVRYERDEESYNRYFVWDDKSILHAEQEPDEQEVEPEQEVKTEEKEIEPEAAKIVEIDPYFEWRTLPSADKLDLTTPVEGVFEHPVLEKPDDEEMVVKTFSRAIKLEDVLDCIVNKLRDPYERNSEGYFEFHSLTYIGPLEFPSTYSPSMRHAMNARVAGGKSLVEIALDFLKAEGCISKYEINSKKTICSVWDHKPLPSDQNEAE